MTTFLILSAATLLGFAAFNTNAFTNVFMDSLQAMVDGFSKMVEAVSK